MMPQPIFTVFVPALLCDEAMYADVIEALGSEVEAHVMLSPRPVLADSAAEILARAPARFALVGSSYGSNLALEIALAAPDRVIALALLGCDANAPKTGGPDLAAGLEAQPDAVIDMLAGLVVPKESVAAAATFGEMARRVGPAAGAAQARAAATRPEAMSRLGALSMPTLLLWGESDPLVPLPVGQALASALPHAELEVLPRCGHLPTLEHPAACAALFSKLLRRATEAG